MSKRILFLLALTLCVGAFLFPVTAYAADAAPTLKAWIDDDLLHVETSGGHSGVEAVYIDSSRVNYRVDGAFDVILRDYAGSGEYISVYAVDFAGQKSNTVQLKNPYYTPPAATPAPSPAPTPTPQPSAPAPTQKPATTPAQTTPAPTQPVTPTPEPSTSGVPDDPQPFTPDGTGTTVDNVTEEDGKEFFTIITEDENTFFLVVDRQRDSENVYLLNAVTEEDLLALAEKGGDSQSAVPTPEPTPQPEPTPEPMPEPEPEPEPQGGMNAGAILLIVLAVLGVGGAGYYFKILKPKQQAQGMDDYDEDDSDDDAEDDRAYDDYDDDPPREDETEE
jgi:hypothetical protein